VAADDLIVLAEVDVVILAAPVRENITLLGALEENVRQAAIVTDTGSTKRGTVEAARSLPARFTFVGGHPLAGAAQGGLEHARADLFQGRPWLLTSAFARGDDSRASARPAGDDVAGGGLVKLTEFVQALGAVPRMMSVQAHDRMLAFLSHLPQLTASALMQVVGDAVGEEGLTLAGRGLADTTRLASSPPDIWRDIAATNADEIGPALDALIARLQDLRRDLPDGDRLAEIFTDAARWRSGIKK
jgi:prephenate dehydrogenase